MPDKRVVYNWYISLLAAGNMVLMGYDASVFNSVQVSKNWIEWFNHPDAYMLGLYSTVYSVGGILAGWFLAGPIADYWGRRWGMAVGCMLTIIATFVQCFAPYHGTGAFMAGRVLVAAGQGIAITSGPVYINEVALASVRGQIMSFWQMFYSVGAFIAYWINYSTAKYRGNLGDWDWRMVVIFQLLMPTLICAQLPFAPESPRWLIAKRSDVEGARNVLKSIRIDEEQLEKELREIQEAIAYEKEVAPTTRASLLALLKDKIIRKRLIIVFLINIGQQLSGQGTLNNYSSIIYRKVFVNTDTVNLINALNATFAIIFTLNATWTVDRYGRRFLFIVGAIGMAICTMLIPTIGLTTPDTATGGKSFSVGVAITFLAFLYAFFYKPSWGATVWIYTAEVFPMHVRAQAVAMSVQMQGVANLIFNQFFPIFFQKEGLKVFFFFMATNILLATCVFFFLPETKGIPLEQMDALFGGASQIEKKAAMMDDSLEKEKIEASYVEQNDKVAV